MKEAIFILQVDAGFTAIALIAWVLAWVITEKLPYQIPVKPFNCRPCCTFWLTFGLCALFAKLVTPYFPYAELGAVYNTVLFTLLGTALAGSYVSFLIVKSKYKIYE